MTRSVRTLRERVAELEYDNTVLNRYIDSAAKALNAAQNFRVEMFNKRAGRKVRGKP